MEKTTTHIAIVGLHSDGGDLFIDTTDEHAKEYLFNNLMSLENDQIVEVYVAELTKEQMENLDSE